MRGTDRSRQDPKAPPLTQVRYPNLWQGIDLSYRAAPGGIAESLYQLQPGADISQVRLRYNRPLSLDAEGSLSIRFDTGILTESAPIAWQEVDGHRQTVSVAFVQHGERELGFRLGAYDPTRPLLIDPSLSWNTFLGGSGDDCYYGCSIAVDNSGNVYVTGDSNATWGSPRRAFGGWVDAFVAKLNSNGTLLWNTFLGGSDGDGGHAIALDASGNVYITGWSYATWGSPRRSFGGGTCGSAPNTYPCLDAFVAKLDPNGALLWNSFLGGSGNDYGHGLALDAGGNLYVTGYSHATWGSPLRAFGGGYDAFVAKLNSNGMLLWNTFLGGSDDDDGSAIAVDAGGNVYVTGESDAPWGNPLRAHSGSYYNAFVAKLNSNGTLLWNTFLGGSYWDWGYGIAVDASGNLYVTGDSGATWGNPRRAFSGGYADAFVAKLSPYGALLWNTFLGGSDDNNGYGLALDGSGNLYVTGNSYATWGSPVRAPSGSYDAFVAKLNSNGALLWNTFLGGSNGDEGYGLALDSNDNLYVTGASYATWGSPRRSFGGGTCGTTPNTYPCGDAFVAKLTPADGPNRRELSVAVYNHGGYGLVYSAPGSLYCGNGGDTCSQSFDVGSQVTLYAGAYNGSAFNDWGGACLSSGRSPTCTLTMDGNKTVEANFVSATPEQTDPDRPEPLSCYATPGNSKAVVITHGWNASAADWVSDMAVDICESFGQGFSFYQASTNRMCIRCQAAGWDVWIADWRSFAFGVSSDDAWRHASLIGDSMGKILKLAGYQHIHLIAHSAGSNAIDKATRRLKTELSNPPNIHETFLDAYDASATPHPTLAGRHSSNYGEQADWADNYVDTRNLVTGIDDKTDLYLDHAFNVDVTPEGFFDGNITDWDSLVRHSRPYRFYGKSIDENYLSGHDYNQPGHDPIGETGIVGYPLSVEEGYSLTTLSNWLEVGTGCWVDADNGNCYLYPYPPPPPASPSYTSSSVSQATVESTGGSATAQGDASGQAAFTSIRLGSAPSGMGVAATAAPGTAAATTEAPSWIVTQVTTSNRVNTLSFDWKFRSGGEGLVRIFVGTDQVGTLDQRYLPLASLATERLYIGELPAGTHRIAFRLDGFGANPSGVELTNVTLGWKGVVKTRGDLDGDGQADILWRNSATGENWLYLMDGNSIQTSTSINKVADQNWKITGVADFDGDGRADILWRNAATGENWLYLMNGNSIQTSTSINKVADQNWKIAGVGDFNGDGQADILWRNSATGENWLYLMDGDSIQTSTSINKVADQNWKIAGVGDFNGDSQADILWRNSATGQNWLYLMDGANILTSQPINAVADLNWKIAGVEDLDGDHKADILWRNSATGENWLYLMNGNSIQTSTSINKVADQNWKIAGVGDFNGDGKADILWRNSSTGENWLYLMDGANILESRPINTVADLNWKIQGGGGN